MISRIRRLPTVVLLLALGACSGGSNSPTTGTAPPPANPATPSRGCDGSCVTADSALTVSDVQTVLARAIAEARGRGAAATIAVVDRVGNTLAIYRMRDGRASVSISSTRGVTGGLESAVVPSELAAISKAVTGAFLSSEGNAFSTRTAGQIVQEHFLPREFGAPSGPLYGVQFSQLLCSDLNVVPAPVLSALGVAGNRTVGPKPAPLGLSADPGGFPLYKGGTVVGGIGVTADPLYSIDLDIFDRDEDLDEAIAMAGTFGYGAPVDRRGDAITADGRTFRFSDIDFAQLRSNPEQAPAFTSLGATDGALIPAFGFAPASISAGTVFTTPASGYVADTTDYPGLDAFVLVDPAGQPRFRPRAGTDGTGALTAAESRAIVSEALRLANRMRAQIRQPASTPVRVTISVVDSRGEILALARTRDAPIFGTDVSLQKARTAAFFSGSFAATELEALSRPTLPIRNYVRDARSFFGQPTFLTGAVAISPRAIGNIARPYFPDGIVGTSPGPFSPPFERWSPFAVGLQLDLLLPDIGEILAGYAANDLGRIAAAIGDGCTGNPRLKNGIQIFPGGVPIYRGNQLIGAVGVSGDGIDQDDMVSFLGLANAGRALGTGFGNAPAAIRADQLTAGGSRLRYVQCPQAPFIDSTEQNACAGI